ncbi:MAG: electron transport complex subunit RsxC [Candidatus Omnitrophota bacterium]|nr:electron transport complex subunit RsxC [Candidatus Omnitrophota bacterium]
MLKYRFGGVHPPDYKELTNAIPIKDASLPSEVNISLSQHGGTPARSIVEPGDKVKCGTKIAESTGPVSSPVHASISGTVKEIKDYFHPVCGSFAAINISSDGRDEKEFFNNVSADNLFPEELRALIREAGVVGLGGAAFPTAVKLDPPKEKPIGSLILNGVECEPYLTSDHRLMLEKPEEIISGAKIVKKILNAANCYLAIEKNKTDAIELMRKKIDKEDGFYLKELAVKYPQGAEKQLIKTLLGREVPNGGLPLDVGVVVNNVGTVLAVYEAVIEGKPLYERVMTVTGSIVKNPQNLRVRIGTKFSHLVRECGGVNRGPAKIIMGGPMMGLAQYSLDVPVVKGTCGIIALAGKEISLSGLNPCLRCGRCVDVCPVGLLPGQISLAAEYGNFDLARQEGALDCIECGACEYICASQRGLVQLIKLAKSQCKRELKNG